MAKNRSIKVISQSGSSYKATPTLTLKGQWLKVLGVEGLRVVLDGLHCRIVNLHAPREERATNKGTSGRHIGIPELRSPAALDFSK